MSNNKSRPRLGRGLSSLISLSNDESTDAVVEPTPESHQPRSAQSPVFRELPEPMAETPLPTSAIHDVPLDKVVPNPHQPRRTMNETSIAELAASLKSSGLIQPIIVRKVDDRYELIAGERRWRAAKVAGLLTVPALVRDATSVEQAQMALVENIQREDLNPIDRALAYRQLIAQLGLTQAELAGRIGEDRSSIANYLRLLDLAPAVQMMVTDGRLSMGHAKILAGLPDQAEQERLANLVIGQSLSVRNLERQMNLAAAPPVRSGDSPSAYLQDLEKSMSQQLGLRVQVRSGSQKGKGKLILHYGTHDQFEELIQKLGVKVES